jgi:hypothetical protein
MKRMNALSQAKSWQAALRESRGSLCRAGNALYSSSIWTPAGETKITLHIISRQILIQLALTSLKSQAIATTVVECIRASSSIWIRANQLLIASANSSRIF